MTTQNLNPVRIMTVQDWMQIAIQAQRKAMLSSDYIPEADSAYSFVVHYMTRFELLTSQPLKEGDFLNEVEKPTEQVFEGFEWKKGKKGIGWLVNNSNSVELFNNDGEWQIWMNGAIIAHPENTTIFDLIYNVHKYNETASNKIELKFTEAFIKKIIP